MRLGEDARWRAVGVVSARIGPISPELRLVGPMRTFPSQPWNDRLGGLDVCVCHHSHGIVQQRVAAVSLRDCAVRGSNRSDPSGMGRRMLIKSSFAARNAQFATSVERFLGFQHVGRHCLATPFLGF
jgi:hypothetical protein